MKLFRFFAVLLFLLPSPSVFAISLYQGSDFSLSFKGYFKNLYVNTKRQATNDPMNEVLNRARTEWDAKFWKFLSAKVIWDNELIFGDYVASEEFAARQTQRAEPYLDMDYELAHKNDFFYGQQFYRAYARLDLDPVVFVAGRQKVDWGVMRLISPGDLFTRVAIFNVEKEERVGATAANLIVAPVTGLKLNAVYEIQPDFGRARLAGRVTKTLGHFDLSVFGGKFLQDEDFGVDFTGDLGKAGVRGEFVYDHAEFVDDFMQFAAGVDYGWENSLYLALEYFFNGNGRGLPITAATFPTGSQVFSVHKNFVELQAKYDLMPLWSVMMLSVVDLNGGSVFLNPESKYAPLSWLEILGGAQIPVGKTGGEFTAFPNAYYFQTQIFF
ncbi:MAG TPA: hypothetical protein VFX30_11005 [bacterium]|nr:hypothetical protein [bacterium]